MKIVVFVKAVADNTRFKLDQINEQGIPADAVPLMMNPYDEYAVETALRLKEAAGEGATISIITMGDDKAVEIVKKKALAPGGDEAFLLKDDAFKLGDSTSAAQALAGAAKSLTPDAKVYIFGQAALDDASAQTGPKVAELLNLPSLTACKNAELEGDKLKVTRESERGSEIYEMSLPGVICMMKCDYELRTANIKGVMKANKIQVPVKTAVDIGIDASLLGQSGATTTVSAVRERPPKEAGKKIDGSDPQAAVGQIVEFLKEVKAI